MTSSIISRAPSGAGFSLLELVMTIAVMAILGTVAVSFVGDRSDAARFAETREKMVAIRAALVGDDTTDREGHRTHFGYVGDMGQWPVTLTSLVTQGSQPSWSFDTYRGFGSGWRGPYVANEFTASGSIANDAWGNSFVWSTSSSATITSKGSDNATSTGPNYAADIAMNIESRFASVAGVVGDGDQRLSGRTVELRYPLKGSQSTGTSTTTASGYFTFSTIPFGPRSLEVTAPSPTLAPRVIVVDQQSVSVPPRTLDYSGSLQKVTYSSGAAVACGSSECIDATLNSSYTSSQTLSYITVNWDRLGSTSDGYLISFTLNGTSQSVPALPPGIRQAVPTTITAPNGNFTLRLTFANASDGTGAINMANTKVIVAFQWSGNALRDTLTYTVP